MQEIDDEPRIGSLDNIVEEILTELSTPASESDLAPQVKVPSYEHPPLRLVWPSR